MKRKTASAIICENFKIPHQTIFQDYKCTFKSALTYFGRLYVGQEHVCFISNMFGILKKCVIEIEKIQKLLEPSKFTLSIEEKTSESSTAEYHFAGFKTNHAYTLIRALWKKQKIESEVLNSNDDEQTLLLGQSSELKPNKDKLIDEGNVESSFFNPKAVEADRQRLCSFQLPCSVDQYYNFFLADDATVYPRKKHLQLRDSREIVITPWRKSEELDSEIKQINALIKVTGVPFLNYAHLSQVWKLRRNENGDIFVDFVTQMSDVPYCNYFVVNNYMEILKESETKCKMNVDISIVFSKSTYMKGKILSKTFEDMKDEYNFWFGQVKAILEKMRKAQESQAANKVLRSSRLTRTSSSDIQFQSNDVPIPEPYLENHYSKKSKISSIHNSSDSEVKKLSLKIDNLTKILIVLVVLLLIQLVFNGILLAQLYGSPSKHGSRGGFGHGNEIGQKSDGL